MFYRFMCTRLLAVALVLGLCTSKLALAQFPYSQGCGSGYGYQNQTFYGSPEMFPSQVGYAGFNNYAPGGFASPLSASAPWGYTAPAAILNQSFYPSNTGFSNPGQDYHHHHHSQHSWHPGHYLMGHY